MSRIRPRSRSHCQGQGTHCLRHAPPSAFPSSALRSRAALCTRHLAVDRCPFNKLYANARSNQGEMIFQVFDDRIGSVWSPRQHIAIKSEAIAQDSRRKPQALSAARANHVESLKGKRHQPGAIVLLGVVDFIAALHGLRARQKPLPHRRDKARADDRVRIDDQYCPRRPGQSRGQSHNSARSPCPSDGDRSAPELLLRQPRPLPPSHPCSYVRSTTRSTPGPAEDAMLRMQRPISASSLWAGTTTVNGKSSVAPTVFFARAEGSKMRPSAPAVPRAAAAKPAPAQSRRCSSNCAIKRSTSKWAVGYKLFCDKTCE